MIIRLKQSITLTEIQIVETIVKYTEETGVKDLYIKDIANEISCSKSSMTNILRVLHVIGVIEHINFGRWGTRIKVLNKNALLTLCR